MRGTSSGGSWSSWRVGDGELRDFPRVLRVASGRAGACLPRVRRSRPVLAGNPGPLGGVRQHPRRLGVDRDRMDRGILKRSRPRARLAGAQLVPVPDPPRRNCLRRPGPLAQATGRLSNAKAYRHPLDPPHRLRPDRDRPGVRVRLLGDAGVQGAARTRRPRHPGQVEPGDDHDRPRVRRPDLHRADDRRGARAHHRGRAADALLPTIGGQTGLNLALDLAAAGVLERHGVELIGASVAAIRRAEDRDLFKETMASIGLDLPRSGYARSIAEAEAIRRDLGLPLIIRPSRTLGGTGGSFATTDEEFRANVAWGLEASPVHEILVEESIAGWKEFELEV